MTGRTPGTTGLVTITPIEAMRQDRKRLMAKMDTLTADNARLREALVECITDAGANCYNDSTPKASVAAMDRRIEAINSAARAALAGKE